jgi:hypothetical protein
LSVPNALRLAARNLRIYYFFYLATSFSFPFSILLRGDIHLSTIKYQEKDRNLAGRYKEEDLVAQAFVDRFVKDSASE